jgi:energy-converting hydrogenase A subunit P
VNGAMKGVFVDNLQDQKDLILLCVNHLEEFINNQEDDLRSLERDGLLQYDVPLSEIWEDALKIIPDEEVALEIIKNAVNRLKVRIIDWDKSKCEKCQLCIPDCPTDCISFDEEEDTIVRDKSRCLRCSICYQTCPFSVIKYFISKFSLEDDENIHVTVKASNLNEDIVE